jgi:hypothetical protein
MPGNNWLKKLRGYWKKPVVRAVAALAVAALAGVVQFRLARIPLPVEVGDKKKVSIPPIRSGEKLIIDGLAAPTQKRPLFAYRGDPKEVVDIHLEQASITPETRANYRLNQKFESVDRLAYTTRPPGRSTGVCATDVAAAAANDGSPPTRIVLFQSEGPGNQDYRNLAVELDREVFVDISTNPPAGPPTDTDEDGPGCIKVLASTTLKHRLEGGSLMKGRLIPNARLDLRFLPLNPSAPIWNGYDGIFEPLRFTSPIFQAKAITISSPNGSALFEAASSSPAEPLRVNKLTIGSNELQTDISGMGYLRVRGEPITLSVFERLKEYPLFSALFLAINGALATWLLSQLSSLFKTQNAQSPKKPKRRKR